MLLPEKRKKMITFLLFCTIVCTGANFNNCLQSSSKKSCDCCKSGFRGPPCDESCPICKTHVQGENCTYYCDGNYCGPDCTMACPENCLVGKGGHRLCEKDESSSAPICVSGCQPGFYGRSCKTLCKSCPRKVCYQTTGVCVGGENNINGNTTTREIGMVTKANGKASNFGAEIQFEAMQTAPGSGALGLPIVIGLITIAALGGCVVVVVRIRSRPANYHKIPRSSEQVFMI